MNRIFLLSIIAGANFMAAEATAKIIGAINSDIGRVVVSAETGMTLYTFRNDSPNTSNCYNDCAVAWPPFTPASAAKADGPLGIIKRKDGSRQWTLQGKPLYFWSGDNARGDVTGDGVGGVWDAVRN